MKKRIKPTGGSTLVELMVTFALLAIFMASAAAVITPCTGIFLKVKSLSYAQSVSDIIMEKVGGEISGAAKDVIISDTNMVISFIDSYGSPIDIEKTSEGYLNIHYREINLGEGSNGAPEVLWPAANWKYDPKAYQGFQIENLSFTKSGGDTTVEINLELKNVARNIVHKATKTIECYNLDPRNPVVELPKT